MLNSKYEVYVYGSHSALKKLIEIIYEKTSLVSAWFERQIYFVSGSNWVLFYDEVNECNKILICDIVSAWRECSVGVERIEYENK